jgi:hypothetical protein
MKRHLVEGIVEALAIIEAKTCSGATFGSTVGLQPEGIPGRRLAQRRMSVGREGGRARLAGEQTEDQEFRGTRA